jgi:cell division protease FtsH
MIDEEVRGLVDGAYNRARQLLSDNIDKLHILSQALLEREILDGEEVEKLLRGERLEPLARDRGNGDAEAAAAGADEEGAAPRDQAPVARVAPTESPGLA